MNTASAPSGGTGLLASIEVPPGGPSSPATVVLGEDILGRMYFSTGVTVAWSTTEATFTAATASDHTLNTWSA